MFGLTDVIQNTTSLFHGSDIGELMGDDAASLVDVLAGTGISADALAGLPLLEAAALLAAHGVDMDGDELRTLLQDHGKSGK